MASRLDEMEEQVKSGPRGAAQIILDLQEKVKTLEARLSNQGWVDRQGGSFEDSEILHHGEWR